MLRTTPAAIQEITGTTVDVTPYLLGASALVDAYSAQALWPTRLAERIECYLAAHMLSLQSAQITAKKLGDTSVSYDKGILGKGLESTRFGQMALVLDTTGTLRMATQAKRASFFVD